jgi:thymidylate kinase
LASADGRDTVALRVLHELERAGISYCVLRGGGHLPRPADEIDLLIPAQQMPTLCGVLYLNGFIRLRTWGHTPHHFFVAYDEGEDRWLKLDVVTRVAFGRPTHEYSTELGDGCLKNRRRTEGVLIPAPEDELVTLLLHCVVDKGSFPLHWQQRIAVLCEEVVDEAYVSDLLCQYYSPSLAFGELHSAVRKNQWEQLLECRGAVMRRLAGRHPIGVPVTRIRDRLLRKLNRLAKVVHPEALGVAILAPDGAGKSTLAEGLRNHFFFPLDQIYMGLYQQREGKGRFVGLGLVGKLARQWRRYLQGYGKRARGRFVIFDRYTYDALLPAKKPLNRWQRCRRWLLAHACPAPDLIVLLDAPGEVLFGRKGEHSPELLEQHRQAYLGLQRRFPQMVMVDAARDADQVRRAVISHIWRRFAGRMCPARHISSLTRKEQVAP